MPPTEYRLIAFVVFVLVVGLIWLTFRQGRAIDTVDLEDWAKRCKVTVRGRRVR